VLGPVSAFELVLAYLNTKPEAQSTTAFLTLEKYSRVNWNQFEILSSSKELLSTV
jgi:hypothetical protein